MQAQKLIRTALPIGVIVLLAPVCQAPGEEPAAEGTDYAADFSAPVEAFVELWHTGNTDGMDAYVAEEFQRTAPAGGSASGLEELKAMVDGFHTAYPDMTLTADAIYYFEDIAIVRWTFNGTNTGPGVMEPTGMAVTISGMTELGVADGKITREDVFFDALSWMETLGFTLTPAAGE